MLASFRRVAVDLPPGTISWATPAPLVATSNRTSVVIDSGPGVESIRVIVVQRDHEAREGFTISPPGRGGRVRSDVELPPGRSVLIADPGEGRQRVELPARRVTGAVPGFAALLDRLREAVTDPETSKRVLNDASYSVAVQAIIDLNQFVLRFKPKSRPRREASYALRVAGSQAMRDQLDDVRLNVAVATLTRNWYYWVKPPKELASRNLVLRTVGRLQRFDWRYLKGRGIGIQPLGTIQRMARDQSRPVFFARLNAALELGVPRETDGVPWMAVEYPWYPGPDPGAREGWASGMTNAALAFQLGRAYRYTGEQRYVDLMRLYLAGLEVPYEAGGLAVQEDGGSWYLEIGTTDRLRILNGFLQAVVSLGRLDRMFDGQEAQIHNLYLAGLASASAHVADYDRPDGWSSYSLAGQRASEFYQAYHVALLRQLYGYSQDPVFARYADRWGAALEAYCAARGASPETCGGKAPPDPGDAEPAAGRGHRSSARP
jgi:hypothetical protein